MIEVEVRGLDVYDYGDEVNESRLIGRSDTMGS